ncbi:hypothetical protein B0T10DRAFT_157187 [Thelonectria olida]|uniref:Uncharacterized protein n=1 Tax=Thelonectria olida TaxID=1576542 RepID=A0A9P8VW34_9HYPO|nr:hypothetical protein B0T10DRAFT_157187 [Thelonectria olida]
MGNHAGPPLIIDDANTSLKKGGPRIQPAGNSALSVTFTHRLGPEFSIEVFQVEFPPNTDQSVTWIENNVDNRYVGPSYDTDETRLANIMKKYLANSVSSMGKLIHEDFCGPKLETIRNIFIEIAKHRQNETVHRASVTWLAYRLATSLPFTTHIFTDPTKTSQNQDNPAPIRINQKIRCVLLQLYYDSYQELLKQFVNPKKAKGPELWLAMFLLLSHLEDVEFDCQYRRLGASDLKASDLKESSAGVSSWIRRFLEDIDFPECCLDTSGELSQTVFSILRQGEQNESFFKGLSFESFDRGDVDSLVGMHIFKLLKQSIQSISRNPNIKSHI